MIPIKLKWGPIICTDCETCICSTLVEYRREVDVDWVTPSTPANPTQNTEYPLTIDVGVYYRARLTFIGPQCNHKSIVIPIYQPTDNCCPAGYTITPDGGYCYQIEDIPATPPSGTPQTLEANPNIAYSTCGSYIYDVGYNINGTGPSAQIPLTNAFWKNGGTCVDNLTTEGPLNRTAVWVDPPLPDQDIGFGVCIDIAETKTYYVAVGADNYGVIKVDGVTIVEQDSVALDSQYSTGGSTFKVWHIYPVTFTAGPHIIEILGHNVSSVAAIGCEIYNATEAEIIAAENYGDLGAKLIFSSKDYVGEPAQIGTDDAGYTCPIGYTLAPCSSPIKCRRILTTPTIDCS